MGLLMKMAKYSVKIGLGYFAVGTYCRVDNLILGQFKKLSVLQ